MIACGPLSGPYLVASSDIDGILSDGPNAKKSRRITIIFGVCCRIIIQGPLGHASTTCDTYIMYCIAEMYCKEQLSDIIIHGGSLSTLHLPQILETKASRKGLVFPCKMPPMCWTYVPTTCLHLLQLNAGA